MRQPCGLILFLQPPDFFHAFLGLRHLSDIIRILAIALFQKGNVCPGSLGKLLSFGEDIAADIIGTPFFCGQDAVRQRNGHDMIIFLLVQDRQDPDAEIVGAQEQRVEGGTALHVDDLPDLVPVDEIQIHIAVKALQGPGISRLHRIQGKIVPADLFHGQRILFL